MADTQAAPFRFWNFFFSLRGRVSRWPFLAFELITRLGMVGVSQFWWRMLHPALNTFLLFNSLVGLFGFIVLWPNFALLFKRFHDAAASGLWALPYFAPFVYVFYVSMTQAMAAQHGDTAAMTAAQLPYSGWILIVINYGLVLVAVLLPARKTANRYGPPPGALPDQAEDVF